VTSVGGEGGGKGRKNGKKIRHWQFSSLGTPFYLSEGKREREKREKEKGK